MVKRAFGKLRTKVFGHRRYTLKFGYEVSSAADRQAAAERRAGRLARTTREINDLGETKFVVWVKK